MGGDDNKDVAARSELACFVCGAKEYRDSHVLWPELVAEWQLSPEEHRYIDRQQGTQCTSCSSNLRSIALAKAIVQHVAPGLHLPKALAARPELRILEINEAGFLTPQLRLHPGYQFAAYPDVDMRNMPYPDETFDLVVHSDTLEHIEHPVTALAECRRILAPGGACCFTVPMIIGRLTSSRVGLPSSYHGAHRDDLGDRNDLVVRTEYGADAWLDCAQAGFNTITLSIFEFPSAIAITACVT